MIELEFYYNIQDKKLGYCKSKSCIRVNIAHHQFHVEVLATISHEITHAILHMNKRHYTPLEKEYQARMVEYNYCHSYESLKALMYYRMLLKEENRNLIPLQNEVKRIYL